MGGLLDEAIELSKNKDNEVLFVYCGGQNELCLFNRGGSRALCKYCSHCTKKVLDIHNVKFASLKEYRIKGNDRKFNYTTAQELRAICYRGVNIGMSIMSGYISATRNLNPLIEIDSKKYFDAHLAQDVAMVDAVYNLIDVFKPDEVHSFNGRYEEVRAIWDICYTTGLKCKLYEGTRVNGKWKKVIFEDHLPHDIKYNVERRDFVWDHYNMTKEEKIDLGKSFYERRRGGQYAGDKIYIENQTKGKIPPIDDTKINIGIFNSSEDEFAAVGAEWDSLKLFPSQKDGIEYMLEHAGPKIHFYLRIHPNLKDIKYKYQTDLLKLEEKYSNVTVIPGSSDISTYDLLDHMNKIVCFWSTIGIESVYWKKPTVLVGPAMYVFDDICYRPADKEDLMIMLASDLQPKFNESVYRFGAYFLDKSPLLISDKNIDYQSTPKKFMGVAYHSTPFISYIINEKITSFIMGVGRCLLGSRLFNRFTVPVKEA
jgi:hypothetical protein